MSIEWDGRGLPSVGCECEALNGLAWLPCIIIAHYDGFIFSWNYDYRITFTINAIKAHEHFRQVLTEAERRREEAVDAMSNAARCADQSLSEIEGIYLAIAAGKIPGIRLTDE